MSHIALLTNFLEAEPWNTRAALLHKFSWLVSRAL